MKMVGVQGTPFLQQGAKRIYGHFGTLFLMFAVAGRCNATGGIVNPFRISLEGDDGGF